MVKQNFCLPAFSSFRKRGLNSSGSLISLPSRSDLRHPHFRSSGLMSILLQKHIPRISRTNPPSCIKKELSPKLCQPTPSDTAHMTTVRIESSTIRVVALISLVTLIPEKLKKAMLRMLPGEKNKCKITRINVTYSEHMLQRPPAVKYSGSTCGTWNGLTYINVQISTSYYRPPVLCDFIFWANMVITYIRQHITVYSAHPS